MHAFDSEIDRLDRKVLAILQTDGRITNLELADKIGLSATATAERVKRLTRDGFISGYRAILSAEKLGLGLVVFIEVKLERTTDDVFDAFTEAALRAPEIAECYLVAGGFDYLIKARVPDMDAYRQFLSDVMLRLPGVRETHTYAVMEKVKSGDLVPV
ncbi:MAG: Lrp/AsnC ligand binding domain-containing protein [Pseudomonadota bacterium]